MDKLIIMLCKKNATRLFKVERRYRWHLEAYEVERQERCAWALSTGLGRNTNTATNKQ